MPDFPRPPTDLPQDDLTALRLRARANGVRVDEQIVREANEKQRRIEQRRYGPDPFRHERLQRIRNRREFRSRCSTAFGDVGETIKQMALEGKSARAILLVVNQRRPDGWKARTTDVEQGIAALRARGELPPLPRPAPPTPPPMPSAKVINILTARRQRTARLAPTTDAPFPGAA